MKDALRILIELQEIDSAIVRKLDLITSIPKKISSVEQSLKEAAGHHDRQKQKSDASEKKKREKERALDEFDERIRKLKARTAEIKSNKEYQAHLKEIEAVEKERFTLEDDILGIMETLESASKDLKGEEAKVKAEKSRVEAFKEKLNEEVAAAAKELDLLKAKRSDLAGRLEKEVHELYFSILETKGGVAVVEAKDEICQGCNMNIPPQLFVELKKSDKLNQCPQCGRILYWRAKDSPAEPESNPAARVG